MTDTEKQITAFEEALAAAFNARDIVRVRECIAPDFEGFSSTTHDRIRGPQEFERTLLYYLDQGDDVRFSIYDLVIHDRGIIALASFQWMVTIIQAGRAHDIRGRGTHILEKRNDKWQIVHEHFSRAYHKA